jgi:hypothetical protein
MFTERSRRQEQEEHHLYPYTYLKQHSERINSAAPTRHPNLIKRYINYINISNWENIRSKRSPHRRSKPSQPIAMATEQQPAPRTPSPIGQPEGKKEADIFKGFTWYTFNRPELLLEALRFPGAPKITYSREKHDGVITRKTSYSDGSTQYKQHHLIKLGESAITKILEIIPKEYALLKKYQEWGFLVDLMMSTGMSKLCRSLWEKEGRDFDIRYWAYVVEAVIGAIYLDCGKVAAVVLVAMLAMYEDHCCPDMGP